MASGQRLALREFGCPRSNLRQIGNPELIAKRAYRTVPVSPGGTLSDYIPFYFTPCPPMLLNIKTGYQGLPRIPMPEVAILVSSLHRVVQQGVAFVFLDRHAYLQTALPSFSSRLGSRSAGERSGLTGAGERRRRQRRERNWCTRSDQERRPRCAPGLLSARGHSQERLESVNASIVTRAISGRAASRAC